jgi:hypothetical protein
MGIMAELVSGASGVNGVYLTAELDQDRGCSLASLASAFRGRVVDKCAINVYLTLRLVRSIRWLDFDMSGLMRV